MGQSGEVLLIGYFRLRKKQASMLCGEKREKLFVLLIHEFKSRTFATGTYGVHYPQR